MWQNQLHCKAEECLDLAGVYRKPDFQSEKRGSPRLQANEAKLISISHPEIS
jgi:hypothetical protein